MCDHKAQTDTDMSYKLSFVLFQIYMINIGPNHLVWFGIEFRPDFKV